MLDYPYGDVSTLLGDSANREEVVEVNLGKCDVR